MKRMLRMFAIILVVIIGLLVLIAGLIFAQSNAKLSQTWDVDVVALDVSSVDAEMLLEGERLFVSRGCGDCHGEDGQGTIFMDDPAMGLVPASNLTSGVGGVGQFYTVEDYVRAIQHGIRPDGTSLVIMPSEDWQQMREEELAPLIAYILALEPVDTELPARQIGSVGRVLLTIGELKLSAETINHDAAGLVDVDYGATVEYGEYLAATCIGCHGANFAGGIAIDPNGPLSSNITPHEDGIGAWSSDDFMAAIRTGVNPDGVNLRAPMPWQSLANMNDEEIEALYLYIQTIEPVPDNN